MELQKMASRYNQIGDRVQSLRKLLGLSQIELSESTGISQSLISHIERGTRTASPEILQKVSKATQTPLTFFDQAPSRLQGSLTFRKGASAIAQDQIVARFEEAERVTNRLSEKVPYKSPKISYATGALDRRFSLDEIEEIASTTRNELGLGHDEPIQNLTRTLERSGIAVISIADKSEHLFAKHDGVTRPTLDLHRPMITYSTGAPGDRERFSKAHELGHEVLHAHRANLTVKDQEWEANAFAGALLLPRSFLEREISETTNLNGYALIKSKTGVSIQATIYRAQSLELITQKRFRSLMVQISSRGWRTQEPVVVHPEKPILLAQMLKKKYGSSPLMLASHDLGIPAKFLSTWAQLDAESTPECDDSDANTTEQSHENVIPLFR